MQLLNSILSTQRAILQLLCFTVTKYIHTLKSILEILINWLLVKNIPFNNNNE